ncbi:hypothetical protein CPB84DRAFT_827577 [Gymnopilus junonius]|uniref:Uncharacterized protein n=1 Tax=Gymnopilus junonius TaxID=109634 RepID=A0A9P5TEQ9_GYMJU|nr:hypothetical protein CPB84DRAFT_827577 [Gymnopilus junonius]
MTKDEVQSDLTVYPLAKREDTLQTNIYLKYTFESPDGPFTVPIHKVPNLCLAKWNVHHIICIFFPALYSKEQKPHLSQDEQ